MKKYVAIALVWCWMGLMSVFAWGAQGIIQDDSGLLTEEQKASLTSLMTDTAHDLGINVIFVSTPDLGDADNVEEFGTKTAIRAGWDNGIMMTLYTGGRKVDIYAFNTHMYNSGERDSIRSAATKYLSEDDYENAIRAFVQEAIRYQDLEDEDKVSAGQLIGGFIVCLLIGGIVVSVMFAGQKSSKVLNGAVYRHNNEINVLEREDLFTHTTVEVIHHERSSSDSGGSAGDGHSSGSY